MIAADALEESKSPNHKEGESFSEENAVEQPSVPETVEQPSVLGTEVVIAADVSEQSF
jgi:hypothetical protein